MKDLSKTLRRFLWEVASIEEYGPNVVIGNGVDPSSDFDFLYVIKGSMSYKLDTMKLGGFDLEVQSTFVQFMQGEYADSKTVTDKQLKFLKGYRPNS